ncbi:MAG: hypothetical protein QNJ22_16620 [Desulfosarcinaceae bacterium]|nr:hypothetical protein [Desulfosarcinaceae bacterium]
MDTFRKRPYVRPTLLVYAFILALSGALLSAGCDGTESRNAVEDTVETVVGKEQVDQFQEVKKELNAIENQQADRYKALEDE